MNNDRIKSFENNFVLNFGNILTSNLDDITFTIICKRCSNISIITLKQLILYSMKCNICSYRQNIIYSVGLFSPVGLNNLVGQNNLLSTNTSIFIPKNRKIYISSLTFNNKDLYGNIDIYLRYKDKCEKCCTIIKTANIIQYININIDFKQIDDIFSSDITFLNDNNIINNITLSF